MSVFNILLDLLIGLPAFLLLGSVFGALLGAGSGKILSLARESTDPASGSGSSRASPSETYAELAVKILLGAATIAFFVFVILAAREEWAAIDSPWLLSEHHQNFFACAILMGLAVGFAAALCGTFFDSDPAPTASTTETTRPPEAVRENAEAQNSEVQQLRERLAFVESCLAEIERARNAK